MRPICYQSSYNMKRSINTPISFCKRIIKDKLKNPQSLTHSRLQANNKVCETALSFVILGRRKRPSIMQKPSFDRVTTTMLSDDLWRTMSATTTPSPIKKPSPDDDGFPRFRLFSRKADHPCPCPLPTNALNG